MHLELKTYVIYFVFMLWLTLAPKIIELPTGIAEYVHQYLTILLPVLIIILLQKKSIAETLKFKKVKPLTFLLVIPIFILSQPLTSFISNLTTYFIGSNNQMLEVMNTIPEGLPTLFAFAITPAICEEFMFRGMLLDTKTSRNLHYLAIMNGIMFGMFHIGYDQIFYTIPLGAILAYVTIMSDSIYPAMLIHFLNNGWGTILQMFVGSNQSALEENITAVVSVQPFENLIAFAMQFGMAVMSTLLIALLLNLFKKTTGYRDFDRINDHAWNEYEIGDFIVHLPFVFMLLLVVLSNHFEF